MKDREGIYHTLTGNMSGCVLWQITQSARSRRNRDCRKTAHSIKTIVTTNMADAIAKYYNVNLIECLTGFKYIGQQILKFETTGVGTYLFGFEESYGCLIGTHARDKDAIVATMALCEAAAYYKSKGMNLWDAMVDMYERYGYYKDDIKSISLSGIEGLAKIQSILEALRQESTGQKSAVIRLYPEEITRRMRLLIWPQVRQSRQVFRHPMFCTMT